MESAIATHRVRDPSHDLTRELREDVRQKSHGVTNAARGPSGKPEHEAAWSAWFQRELGDGEGGEAAFRRPPGDGTVVAAAQRRREMNAGAGGTGHEIRRAPALQRVEQGVAPLAIGQAHAAQVPGEMLLAQEVGEHQLLQQRRGPSSAVRAAMNGDTSDGGSTTYPSRSDGKSTFPKVPR